MIRNGTDSETKQKIKRTYKFLRLKYGMILEIIELFPRTENENRT
jgi:hypothetical protein